jgi:hypothetical protein
MINLDKIIDAELHHTRNIGCIVNIVDEEYEEETVEQLIILLKDN